MGFIWPPDVLNECQTLFAFLEKFRMRLKLYHFSFFLCPVYTSWRNAKFERPKIALGKFACAEILSDSCSSVLRNFDLKCGNDFWDTWNKYIYWREMQT